jgi:hypothetical protein
MDDNLKVSRAWLEKMTNGRKWMCLGMQLRPFAGQKMGVAEGSRPAVLHT